MPSTQAEPCMALTTSAGRCGCEVSESGTGTVLSEVMTRPVPGLNFMSVPAMSL